MDIYEFTPGDGPLLVSIPHSGTHLPDDIAARLTPIARTLPDTDWHVDRLYDFLEAEGVARLKANCSRYVIDLNRPADDRALYPGQVGTGLVPTTTFEGEALYVGDEPNGDEVAARIVQYWQPYHDRLQTELAAIVARHGYAVLWDAHSIKSQVPRLFDGRLPDLNFGTNSGRSASGLLAGALSERVAENGHYTHVLDGRFRGGYITRHYGRPDQRVHAVQLEMAQAIYMNENTPGSFDEDKAGPLCGLLRSLIDCARGFSPGD